MASTIKVSRWVALSMIASLAACLVLVGCGSNAGGDDADPTESTSSAMSTAQAAHRVWNDAWNLGLGPKWVERSSTKFYVCANANESSLNRLWDEGGDQGANVYWRLSGDCDGKCDISNGEVRGTCRYEINVTHF